MELDLFHDYCDIVAEISKNDSSFSKVEIFLLAAISAFLSAGIIIANIPVSIQFLGIIFIIIGIIAIVVFCIIINKKSNPVQAKIRHRNKENAKHIKLRKLLEEYGINYQDESAINKLIDLLKSQQDKYYFWGKSLVTGKEILVVTILPVFTYVITRIADRADILSLLKGAILLIFIIAASVTFSWAIYQILDRSLNKTYHYYEYFIDDIKQVYVFGNCDLDNASQK